MIQIIAVQLLGLVEPQSSGIGGGTFITYFDEKQKIFSYEGREKSIKKMSTKVFLDKSGNQKIFSRRRGVLLCRHLKTLKLIHEDFVS